MRDHTKLRAFELADEVAVLVYRVTAGFPKVARVTARQITFDSSIWPSDH